MLGELQNHLSYEGYPTSFSCKFLCKKDEVDHTEALDLIPLIIDLATVHAIEDGKPEDAMEYVLQVEWCYL